MVARKPKRKRVTAPAEARVRAHHIFRLSGGMAKPITIARQLDDEGYGEIDPAAILRWSKAERWDEKAVAIPTIEAMSFSEDMRQAVRMKGPDDLERVERASHALAELSGRLAQHLMTQIPNLHITTVQELESASRSMTELVKVQLAIGKSISDLRLLRVSSNFGQGEIIPPQKNDAPPPPTDSTLADAISNFQ